MDARHFTTQLETYLQEKSNRLLMVTLIVKRPVRLKILVPNYLQLCPQRIRKEMQPTSLLSLPPPEATNPQTAIFYTVCLCQDLT